MYPETTTFHEDPREQPSPNKKERAFDLPETSSAELFENINHGMDAILRTKEELTELENGPRLSRQETKAALDRIRETFLVDTLGAIHP